MSADVLEAALELARRNWRVFPIRERGKVPVTQHGVYDATCDPERLRRYPLWRGKNLGVATGRGLLVVDVDGELGAESLRALELEHGELPATVCAVTGSGGSHYFLRCGEDLGNSAGKLGAGIDTRGSGGYVVVSPSRHPSGRRYEWEVPPGEVPLAPVPAWVLERLRGDRPGVAARPPGEWCELVAGGFDKGQRNDQLARLCGHLLRRHVNPFVALELLQVVNGAKCRPPLPAREVEQIVGSISAAERRRRTLRAVA
jgi:hypothetical protein